MGKYKFAHIVVGEVPARSKAQAYMIVQMSISIASRLLSNPCDVSVNIVEMTEQEAEGTERINLNRILAQVEKERRDGSY